MVKSLISEWNPQFFDEILSFFYEIAMFDA